MLLNVEHLSVTFLNADSPVKAVDDVSFFLDHGEILGIVGESGSGKSTAAHAIMGLLQRSRSLVSGQALFNGKDLLAMSCSELRSLQGWEMSIIFQEPMTSLNPTMKVGKQVEEALLLHSSMNRAQRKQRALEAMDLAELQDPERIYERYPHELSGGMRQRVMIASALVNHPKLLIADEPTTALDVTIQADILSTLKEINRKEKTSILFISHDLGVIRHLCQRVVVMREGKIVEEGEAEQLFQNPREEYTKRLLASRPTRRKLKGGDHG